MYKLQSYYVRYSFIIKKCFFLQFNHNHKSGLFLLSVGSGTKTESPQYTYEYEYEYYDDEAAKNSSAGGKAAAKAKRSREAPLLGAMDTALPAMGKRRAAGESRQLPLIASDCL